MMTQWKKNDWCIFDLRVGQIKRIETDDDGTWDEFSDGIISTSGQLQDRFRPLTLQNKTIVETFDWYYRELDKMDGSGGFNFPAISRYFNQLALNAIDASTDEDRRSYFQSARDFVDKARDVTNNPIIDGVRLFRRRN